MRDPCVIKNLSCEVSPPSLVFLSNIFVLQAQKQIFNLMKFDSYPRFLKSDVYKNYLMREISGERITLSSDMIDPDLLSIQNVPKAKNAKVSRQ